jgi:uncharacterized membrane protein
MQTMTIAEPVSQPWTADPPADIKDSKTTDLVELMLKDQRRLDSLIREDSRAPELIPRLLAIALVGFTIFGIAATLIINLGGSSPSWMPRARWSDGTWANLTLAYVLGLVGATGVCLPSFYFYGLLAGVKLSMLQSAAHAVKCLAVTSVVLVGALPIYVAMSLGMIVFSAPDEGIRWIIGSGLALPFMAGLWGVKTLFLGFADLAETLPPCRKAERACFLRRLTVAWSACYTTVTPVMIIWLWTRLSG